MSKFIRLHSVYGLTEVCDDLGFDARPLLRSAGLPDKITADTNSLVNIEKLIHIADLVAQHMTCPHLGLLIAQRQDIRFAGSLGVIMACASNLGEALEAGKRYIGTYSQGMSSSVVREGPYSRFILLPDFKHRIAIDLALAHSYILYRHITHGQWQPKAIYFSFRQPEQVAIYRQFFKTNLVFEAEFDGFIFDEQDLDAPLPGANAQVFKALTHYGNLLLEQVPDQDIESVAKNHIKQSLLLGESCTVALLSQRMNMHVRSLQRLLKSNGLSYQQLLREVRLDLAQLQLSNTTHAIAQIADMLGYQDLSSFSIAFKKACGVSPRAYRSQFQAGDKYNGDGA